ncbi:universal stress protein [Leptolyngbya sp. AN02str]|uniref:universal stress protein n=1 Tax=Leptolyngbya sp. AN02str TaxID=3423363 RepID=UPI003D30FD1E
MFHSVLICTDFTDGLYRLVDFVPSLVEGGLKKIVFVSTVPVTGDSTVPRSDSDKLTEARDRLSRAVNDVPAGVEVHVEVDWGVPTDHILSTAKKHSVDVILLGTPSRSLLNEKLFGSTTIGLCQRTPIPVMIIRPQLISAYTVEELRLRCQHLFRYFLIPYDGSETAQYTVDRIKQYIVGNSGSTLKGCLLCWVVEPSHRNPELQANELDVAKKELAKVKSELEALEIKVDTQVLVGNAVTEVLNLAIDYDISAIASSSRTLGKLIELSVPSFTGEVLRRSWHPVVYFPPKR